MDLPGDFTSFWSALVLPGKPCIVRIPDGAECCLTTIALDQQEYELSGRTVLSVMVNSGPVVAISAFRTGVVECAAVDLRFGKGDTLVFTVSGERAVHISGYVSSDILLEIDNGAPPEPEPAPQEIPRESEPQQQQAE